MQTKLSLSGVKSVKGEDGEKWKKSAFGQALYNTKNAKDTKLTSVSKKKLSKTVTVRPDRD